MTIKEFLNPGNNRLMEIFIKLLIISLKLGLVLLISKIIPVIALDIYHSIGGPMGGFIK